MGKGTCHVSSDWLLIVLDRSTLPKFESAKMFCQNLTRCACADIFIMVSCSGDSKMKILFKASNRCSAMWETLLFLFHEMKLVTVTNMHCSLLICRKRKTTDEYRYLTRAQVYAQASDN